MPGVAIEPLPDEPIGAPPGAPIEPLPDELIGAAPGVAIDPDEPESDMPPLRGAIAEPVEPAEACSSDFWLSALVAADPLEAFIALAWW